MLNDVDPVVKVSILLLFVNISIEYFRIIPLCFDGGGGDHEMAMLVESRTSTEIDCGGADGAKNEY